MLLVSAVRENWDSDKENELVFQQYMEHMESYLKKQWNELNRIAVIKQ